MEYEILNMESGIKISFAPLRALRAFAVKTQHLVASCHPEHSEGSNPKSALLSGPSDSYRKCP